ncbi:TonB-dependent receptor [Sphingopyxis lindanitolerans]|nr:TonB-dependent receptor [Sphingopyxis lindanitolerans]
MAAAQEAGTPAEGEGASQGPALQDIIVTAQKRAQSLQDVPVAVQAISGEALLNQGTPGLETLSSSVPMLHISYGGLSEQLFIRGVGSGSSAAFEQSVGLFQDGIAMGVARLSRLAFLDTEQVEILKGPQSTLFGKSTIGGAVNITSGQPRFSLKGQAVGLFDIDGGTRRSVEGYVTGPLSDTVAARLAVKASTADGAFFNTYTDRRAPYEKSVSGRFSLLANPADNLELFASLQASRATSFGRSAQIGFVDTRFANVNSFVAQVRARDADEDFMPNRFRSAGRNPIACDECGKDQAVIGTFRATLDIGAAKMVSLTGYIDSKWREQIDADATPLPIVNTFLNQSTRQFSEELRIESDPNLRFTYIGGVYFQNAQIDAIDSCSDFDLGVLGRITRIRSCTSAMRDESTMGVFAQGTYEIAPGFRITAGGRYQTSDRNIHNIRYVPDPGTGTTPTTNPVVLATAAAVLGQRPFDVKRSSGESRLTPSASIEWEPYDGGLLYAGYRTGFKQGGFDSSIGTFSDANYQFAPETAESFEIGYKTSLLGRRGRLNINAFTSTFDDLQLSSFNGIGFTVRNAAKARSRGVEAEIEFAVTDGFTIGGNAAYLDASYASYADAPCYANQTAVGGCMTVGGTRAQDLSGHSLAYSPNWSGSLFANLRQPVGGGLVALADFRVSARTSQEYGPDGDPNRIAPGVALYDLRVGIGDADGRWEFAVVGKNLTNEYVPSFGFNVPLVAGAYTVQVDQPRVIALQAKARF